MRTVLHWTFIVVIFLLAGCSLGGGNSSTVTPAATSPAPTPPNPEASVSPPTPNSLTIWVPSDFAPDPDTPAGTEFTERLSGFEQAHPGMRLTVRTKSPSGESGILESLSAAYYAAPDALPDVILLDAHALNIATLKGFVVPLGDLVPAPAGPEWYEHAVAASQSAGDFYGLPVTSEAYVLAYRSALYAEAPLTWTDLLAGPAPFVFPAGDPASIVSLTLYLSLDGSLQDSDGRPSMDRAALTDLLSFYAGARSANILPRNTDQYTSAAETWALVRNGQAASGVAPLSLFLFETDFENTNAVALPSRSEPGVSIAETWSLAIVTEDPARQALAAELLSWLSAPEFLGPWTFELKRMPPTGQALAQWPPGAESALTSSLVTVTRAGLTPETLVTFGPPVKAAVIAVIYGEAPPAIAAQDAIEALQQSQID